MKQLVTSVFALGLLVLPASADVVISGGATKNMSCSAGVCTPTAAKAVLNATDLANMLAAGDVTVATGAGAVTIAVDAPFSWTSASRLTLEAQESVNVSAVMAAAGPGGLTVTTGADGDFAFLSGGQADFWDMSSSLIINGTAYVLVDDIHSLVAAIAANPSGSYALGDGYDASADGIYKNHAVASLMGNFDGLGHTIDKFSVRGRKDYTPVTMFESVNGRISDIHLTNARILLKGPGQGSFVGGLAGGTGNNAVIVRASVDGSVTGGVDSWVGGIVAHNGGTISLCSANVSVTGGLAGGLVGWNDGIISRSWAAGQVTATIFSGQYMEVGGLVGYGGGNEGSPQIVQSYATASVTQANDTGSGGGVTGAIEMLVTISESYSTGAVSGAAGLGGFIGNDNMFAVKSADYWDVDTSGMSNGTENGGNVRGIKGLTTAQFQSGLPAKFDRKVWAQSPDVNNGYPYLIANPPR